MKRSNLKLFFRQKQTGLLFILLIIASGLWGAVQLVNRIQETRRRAALEQKLPVIFAPPAGSYDQENLAVTIGITPPQGWKIAAYDLTLAFENFTFPTDPASLRPLFEPPAAGGQVLAVISKGSLVKVIGVVTPAGGVPKVDLVKVNFKGITRGKSFTMTVKSASAVGACGQATTLCNEDKLDLFGLAETKASYTRPLAPTSTPTPTPTKAPTLPPVINFRIRFDGVNRKVADQRVKIKVVGSQESKTFENVLVVADENGIFSGTFVAEGIEPGSGYTFIIKGPKHLGMKLCENNQTGVCLGRGSLTLVSGENNFNFTGLRLLAGDIPDEQGVQDGVVDSSDLSILIQALKAGAGAELKQRADLNFDGLNNTADIQLFLNTMSKKYDDEAI